MLLEKVIFLYIPAGLFPRRCKGSIIMYAPRKLSGLQHHQAPPLMTCVIVFVGAFIVTREREEMTHYDVKSVKKSSIHDLALNYDACDLMLMTQKRRKKCINVGKRLKNKKNKEAFMM